MKRIALFLITNIAILLVLSIVLQLVGFQGFLDERGVALDYSQLLVFCAVFGMGGSFISLALSKWMAKRMTGAQVIAEPRTPLEQHLFQTISHHAQAAGIGMPEVAIFDSPDVNAFATGASRNNALVAVSTGLLQRMDRPQVDAVLGHEITHIANGDMITLTLIQGVVNTFVLFLSRVAGYFVDRVVLRNERGLGIGFFITTIVCQIVFGILASVIVLWFSRQREFRADAGGARLAGRGNMVSALEALQRAHTGPLPEQMSAFGISGKPGGAGLKRLFMSHPPLEERIAALQNRSQEGA
jgi:heat shock protein HtpX